MAKISQAAKKKYFEKIKEYKKLVNGILEGEKKLKIAMLSDKAGANYKKLQLSDENINLVSYYLLMNSLSVALLGVKNEAFLNEARKCCYKSIIYLEEIVSTYIDAPFSEYEDRLVSIEEYDDIKRYNLVRKLGFAIASVEDAFGINSKWKWSFVELEGRYTTVLKNLINLKTVLGRLNPSVPGYNERREHLDLAVEMLKRTSARYREKYELSTLRIDDMKQGIHYLAALKRLQILLGESEELEITKRKIDVWTTKMEADSKKKDEEKIRKGIIKK
ncbi:MAG: hypothetical protein JW822_05400 [Spirochaetales bacterium]|nr:hypothetical protein [Spirochaetales bacterium]